MKRIILLLLIILAYSILNAEEICLLIHGINGDRSDFEDMENYLEEHDYTVLNFEYPSTIYELDYLSENYLKPVIDSLDASFSEINIVTHSMGGILLRCYLKSHEIKNLKSLVMITPPNKGSEVTDFFHKIFVYKRRYGPAGQQLGTKQIKQLELPDSLAYNFGVIAGSKSEFPFFSWFLVPGKDDGKVSVESAKLKGMDDFLILPYPHDKITFENETIDQTLYYIENSFFRKEGENNVVTE